MVTVNREMEAKLAEGKSMISIRMLCVGAIHYKLTVEVPDHNIKDIITHIVHHTYSRTNA